VLFRNAVPRLYFYEHDVLESDSWNTDWNEVVSQVISLSLLLCKVQVLVNYPFRFVMNAV
jgi:hypothetical protein